MKISIIGGGNLGTYMACSFANKGHDVNIITSRPKDFSKKLKIYSEDEKLISEGKISLATDNMKDGIENSQIIFITVPPQLFSVTAQKLDPLIKNNQSIGIVPGAGGAEFAFKKIINKGVNFFGFARVPTIARLKEYGKSVYMLGEAPELLIGSIPSNNASMICDNIKELFDMKCLPVPNYLNVSFTPSNPILHTTRIYSMFKDYIPGNYYPRNELFYEEWSIDAGKLLLNCSDELQYLCKAIPLDLRYVESMQSRHNARTPEELSNRICNIDRLKGLYSPVIKERKGYVPDFNSRYFVSDFPLGIKIIIEIAKLFDVETPNMNMIWSWYEKVQPNNISNSFALNTSVDDFIKLYE